MRLLLFLVLLSGMMFSQVATGGGNVTQLNVSGGVNSSHWNGFYGEVVLGIGANQTVNSTGNRVIRLNMLAGLPPCTYSSISMHIVAVNATYLTIPLSAGNLSKLDTFINSNLSENGSTTFTTTSNFTLGYGTFTSVPTLYTYAGNASSPDFREGYLNDAGGNLVFITTVVSNAPDWNGSTSDYQLILPNNGSATNYTLWADVIHVCAPQAPVGGPSSSVTKYHKLSILPILTQTVKAGHGIAVPVTVANPGVDYTETDIRAYADCPTGFTCGDSTIGWISTYSQKNTALAITAGAPGEYVITVHAKNDYLDVTQEFILRVTAECSIDSDCNATSYCETGLCKPKKKLEEKCERDGWCLSDMCSSGECSLCKNDNDCNFDQACTAGYCVKVTCPCGSVASHKCAPYECCKDADCKSGEFCIDKKCVKKQLEELVIKGNATEGENLLIQVANGKGEPIGGVTVFTSDMQTTTDSNGYATIIVPYDGVVYAYKEGYDQVGKLLSIIRKGAIQADAKTVQAGQPVTLGIVDSKGRPIAGATVTINGATLTTDENGYFTYTFDRTGEQIIHAAKAGYQITDRSVTVAARETACGFPVFLNILWFYPGSTYMLWLLSLAMAAANLYIVNRRLGWGALKSLAYAFLPIILALPGSWPLPGICFMSNVIILEFILAVVLGMLGRKNKLKE